jgi:hypothetical protein
MKTFWLIEVAQKKSSTESNKSIKLKNITTLILFIIKTKAVLFIIRTKAILFIIRTKGNQKINSLIKR